MRNFIIALALIISGCAPGSAMLILDEAIARTGGEGGVTDKTLNRAATAVDRYCLTVPEFDRTAMRDRFNARTSVGDMHIHCP